jgi:hypothetical protein
MPCHRRDACGLSGRSAAFGTAAALQRVSTSGAVKGRRPGQSASKGVGHAAGEAFERRDVFSPDVERCLTAYSRSRKFTRLAPILRAHLLGEALDLGDRSTTGGVDERTQLEMGGWTRGNGPLVGDDHGDELEGYQRRLGCSRFLELPKFLIFLSEAHEPC